MSIKVDTDAYGADVGLLLETISKSIDPISAKAALRAANYAGGEIAKSVVRFFPRGKGALARSFLPATFLERKPGLVSAGALSDLIYARIQDEGGTITPKTVKLLAVPISNVAKTKWPRDWPADALQFVKTGRGKMLLIDAKSKNLVVHYVLQSKVVIRGRHYLDDAEARAQPKIEAIFHDLFGESITAIVKQV